MKVLKAKILIVILVIGLLSACGSPPASQPTETVAPVISSPSGTEAPTNPPAPTDTAVIPTDTAEAQPTEAPTKDPAAPASTVSFANDVFPLLKSRCSNCHGGNKTEEGLSVRTYADLIKGSDNGPVIVPGDVENSLLIELVSTQEMPKRGPKLTPPEIQLIIDWVTQGALDN